MLKKILPKKEDEETRRRHALSKIIFLCIIALSVLMAHVLLQMRSAPSKASHEQSTPKSLGAATTEQEAHAEEQIKKGLAQVQETAEFVRQELEASTENAVIEGKKQVEDTANRLLYDTTLRPMVNKINTLPPQQQQYIKEQICPQQ